MRTCIKLHLFNSAVLSVLLYGSETWVLTEKLEKILNSFHTTCLRIILGVSQEDRITNSTVYRMSGTSPLSLHIQERQLRFLGHSLRRSHKDPINTYALYDPKHGKRGRGRKTDLYAPYVKKILARSTAVQLAENEIRRAAQDRSGWRDLVMTACCFQPP